MARAHEYSFRVFGEDAGKCIPDLRKVVKESFGRFDENPNINIKTQELSTSNILTVNIFTKASREEAASASGIIQSAIKGYKNLTIEGISG